MGLLLLRMVDINDVYMAEWLAESLERKPRPSQFTGRAIYYRLTMEAYIDLLNDDNSLSIYYLSNNRLALTVYQIILACRTVTVFQSLAFDNL